jgi:hypothetical protein
VLPSEFKTYTGDHADLMVRFLMTITPDEQRRLQGRSGGGGASAPGK